jgi:hypothetical protein
VAVFDARFRSGDDFASVSADRVAGIEAGMSSRLLMASFPGSRDTSYLMNRLYLAAKLGTRAPRARKKRDN